jgi:hypothetical protein
MQRRGAPLRKRCAEAAPHSSPRRHWKPFLPAGTAGDFTMKDLVKFTLG